VLRLEAGKLPTRGLTLLPTDGHGRLLFEPDPTTAGGTVAQVFMQQRRRLSERVRSGQVRRLGTTDQRGA
jgi:hypothetical protein